MNIFIMTLFTDPLYFFMAALVVVFSVCLHEYFHAQMALWEGDPTAADSGHLTLNPLRQMGVISLIMFCIMGLCWGSTPINPRNFRSRWSDLKVSIAGPAANLLLFSIAWVAFGLLANKGSSNIALRIFIYQLGVINFMLLFINMLPIPGLDGWGVLCTIFPKVGHIQSEAIKGFMIFTIFAAFLFIGKIELVAKILLAISIRIFS